MLGWKWHAWMTLASGLSAGCTAPAPQDAMPQEPSAPSANHAVHHPSDLATALPRNADSPRQPGVRCPDDGASREFLATDVAANRKAIANLRQLPVRDAAIGLAALLDRSHHGTCDAARPIVEALAELLDHTAWSELPHDALRETMLRGLIHPATPARVLALRTLGRFQDDATVPALMSALSDEEAEVRQVAAEVLGQLSDVHAAPALVRALHDPDAAVQRAAIVAICAMNHRPAIPHLTEIGRRSPDVEVQRAAQDALRRLQAATPHPAPLRRTAIPVAPHPVSGP